MTTVDELLLKIVNSSNPSVEDLIPARDSRVLRSLAGSVISNYFITENQSKLLLRILKENRKKMEVFGQDIDQALKSPLWSRHFRQMEQVRKVKLQSNSNNEFVISIEFTYSSAIRKSLLDSKKIEGLTQESAGRLFLAEYTERNIVEIINVLAPYNFTVDEILQNHYNTIKSWSEDEVKNQFLLENMSTANFIRLAVEKENLLEEKLSSVVIDRSKRYQYFLEKTEIFEEPLLNSIVNREKSRMWVSSNKHTLAEVVAALTSIKRLPLLVIFPNYEDKKLPEILENLEKSLTENGISDGVGIYFRMENTEGGKKFNSFIAEKKYNAMLDDTTKVVGIQSGKIPKFLLSSEWKPMSVISLDTNIRNNKVGVYSDCCDLVITYSDQEPMMGAKFI